MGNAVLLIIDGLGVGAQEDAGNYGDEDTNTLGHVCEVTGCALPNFKKMGLGNIIDLKSVPPDPEPLAAYGRMREVSAGKDSTTGHWELAGIQLDRPFPTYPDGFPEKIIEKFCGGIGREAALCNGPYSGTRVIEDYGEEHLRTGYPIVYTSADSVFQVATHVDVVAVDTLYEWCIFARDEIMTGEHGVGRVIARPFDGEPGNFRRISDRRRDFSLPPPEENLVALLYNSGVKTYAIGKIIDLFANRGFTQYRKTKSNAEGISQLLSLMTAVDDSFIFANLIDTDQLYGHRLDPEGYARCLQEIDRAVPAIASKIVEGDLLIITGDHGNDPTVTSTDHSREFVPLLVYPTNVADGMDLGIRETFSDVASTIADFFGMEHRYPGNAFINTNPKTE